MNKEQRDEIERCAVDFPYFCEKYVNILNHPIAPGPTRNSQIIPFKLHDYQVRLYNHIESNRFTIFSKFRQGGFSTELAIYGLWRCLFRIDQNILWIAKTDRDAVDVCDGVIKRALGYMPDWLKGNVLKITNSHQKSFPDTDSSMFFGTPEAACSKAASLLVIDEASFIKNIDSHWKSFYPCLSLGGSCVILSTPNSDTDWFWTMLEDAALKLNQFSIYSCHYRERPEFCCPEWEAETRHNLGAMWTSEMEQRPAEAYIAPKRVKKENKIWRSIFDESSIITEGQHESA